MYRLFHQKLFGDAVEADEENRIRMDDLEMREDIQKAVSSLWEKIYDNNLEECADIDGYWHDFYELFGFDLPDVDVYKRQVWTYPCSFPNSIVSSIYFFTPENTLK